MLLCFQLFPHFLATLASTLVMTCKSGIAGIQTTPGEGNVVVFERTTIPDRKLKPERAKVITMAYRVVSAWHSEHSSCGRR